MSFFYQLFNLFMNLLFFCTKRLPCLVFVFVFFWTCLVLLIVWNVLFLIVSWMHVKVKLLVLFFGWETVKLLVEMQHADRMIVVNNNNIKVFIFEVK